MLEALDSPVSPPFVEPEQQADAGALGMWLFLATEVLFFGALFLAYTVYRYLYADGFIAAAASMNRVLGAMNTAILLTSSLTAAFAVKAAQERRRQRLTVFSSLTALLGLVFDGIKAYEWVGHYHEHLWPGVGFSFPGQHAESAQLFFVLYYVMTGVHAVHVLIGVGVFATLALMAQRGQFARGSVSTPKNAGLYWHFVDIVWVFLFPLFYLVGG